MLRSRAVRLQRCSRCLLTHSLANVIGVELMKHVVQKPVRQIAENAGVDGAVVARKVLAGKGATHGFNALTKEYGDMIEFGVVDPTKVTRSALQNAVSIATLLLTTDCVITDLKQDDKAGDAGEM